MAIDITEIENVKKASNQNGSMESHSLSELIAYDRYVKANAAITTPTSVNNPFTFGTFKLVPPGAR